MTNVMWAKLMSAFTALGVASAILFAAAVYLLLASGAVALGISFLRYAGLISS
jgi:hypothetical protein